MKLLFDQNISFRIIKLLSENFENSSQVRELGLENNTDNGIWNFAKAKGYTIVTFDADFADIAYINGHPPKIIWLKTGNLTTRFIAELLNKNAEINSKFCLDSEFESIACLELYQYE
ncbi:MAG: DUF5615 family PIN-like protein [Bacteroidota bacterium]